MKDRNEKNLNRNLSFSHFENQHIPPIPSTGKIDYIVKVPSQAKAKELKSMSWQSLLFYHLLRCKSKRDRTDGLWINISSSSCQKKFGKAYRRHIDDLLKRKWIEENPHYLNAENGFTKSYRLAETYQDKHKQFAVSLLQRIWERFAGDVQHDKSESGSPYIALIKERHDTLYMNTARSVGAKRLKTKLDRKTANVRMGSNNRVYSSIILSPKSCRKDVIFGSSGHLVNVDISGMIQQILNIHVGDKKWNQWIEEDFPTRLQQELDIRGSRKKVKTLFMKAISKDPTAPKAKEVRHFLDRTFPKVMEYVDQLNLVDSVQAQTQQIEAKIISSFIMQCKDLPMIPAHDGVFCGEKDAIAVQRSLETFLKRNRMVGRTKINFYNPTSIPKVEAQRPKTIVEILEQLAASK